MTSCWWSRWVNFAKCELFSLCMAGCRWICMEKRRTIQKALGDCAGLGANSRHHLRANQMRSSKWGPEELYAKAWNTIRKNWRAIFSLSTGVFMASLFSGESSMVRRQFRHALYGRQHGLSCASKEPEQSHIRHLAILCVSIEGFSGLLADGKCSTKNLLGGLRHWIAGFSSVILCL